MTITRFSELAPQEQMDHLKNTSTLIHRIIKGNIIVSLYWSNEFVFEVLNPKNDLKEFEIKCFDRFKYHHS